MMVHLLLFLVCVSIAPAAWSQPAPRSAADSGQPIATLRLHADLLAKKGEVYALRPVSFNTPEMDFSPYPYDKGIVFVSSRTQKGTPSDEEAFLSLFYVEETEEGTFSVPERLHPGNVTSYHEGPAVIFQDGNKKILTRNTTLRKSKIKSENPLELAFSERVQSGKWTDPVTLPFSSPAYSVAHPAISSDGTTLYFSSNMPGSVGATDIFVSHFRQGEWSEPRNLGTTINTPGKELFPYLYNDSILFFASDGHRGFGGLDIFYVNLKQEEPTISNFGTPVNSEGDDFGLILEANGDSGFLSSNRKGGQGSDDLYYFEVIQPFTAIHVRDSLTQQPVHGAIISLRSGNEWRETRSDFTGKAEFRSNPLLGHTIRITADGYRPSTVRIPSFHLRTDHEVALTVYLEPTHHRMTSAAPSMLRTHTKEGLTNIITFDSRPLDVDFQNAVDDDSPPDTVASDSVSAPLVHLVTVEVVNDMPAIFLTTKDSVFRFTRHGEDLVLKHPARLQISIPRGAGRSDYEKIISDQMLTQGYALESFRLIRSFFFDTGKTWVRNDASAQLDKIADLMHTYPRLDLEMIFHADSRGTDNFNFDLSKARSVEVTDYLLMAGVGKERIHSSYVGESKPLKDCGDLSDCDDLLHQLNRTVEFKFILK